MDQRDAAASVWTCWARRAFEAGVLVVVLAPCACFFPLHPTRRIDPEEQQVGRYASRGFDLIAEGQPGQAIAVLNSGILINRGRYDHPLLYYRGIAKLQVGDTPAAIRDLEQQLQQAVDGAYYVPWVEDALRDARRKLSTGTPDCEENDGPSAPRDVETPNSR